jgi:hypothetical protein
MKEERAGLEVQIKNKTMKINFEKLSTFEQSCYNSSLTLQAVNKMIENVLNYREDKYENAPQNIKMAIDTLKDLGIIEEGKNNNIQQLNS